jgi:metal-responsive CopG/Arc/MetJ family transcriptional regulator
MEKAKKDRGKTNIWTHTQISLRLPNELMDQIQRLGEKERRNRSNMIEYLLREKLREIAKK